MVCIAGYFLNFSLITGTKHSARERFGSTTSKNAASQQAQGEATNYTIRFCFGIVRVLDHSLWYAGTLVAQLNGCASSTSQAYLAYTPMR